MPAIKAAVGGKVWEKRQKKEENRAGPRVPPSVLVGALQGDAEKVLVQRLWTLEGNRRVEKMEEGSTAGLMAV